MNIEVRYARSFLKDLKSLESTAYERVYDFVFVQFADNGYLRDLPGLRQIDAEGVFFRFSIDDYLVGIEVRGQIVKFLRVIPIPNI